MLKKLTALLLALVLCVGIASTALASKGPFNSIILKNDAEINFEGWNSTSYGRAMATWLAVIEMVGADVSIDDIDLTKPSYVGLYDGSGSLDIFLPTSKGYINPIFGKDGKFNIYEFPSYTTSTIESKYPNYKRNDMDDMLEAGQVVSDTLFGD